MTAGQNTVKFLYFASVRDRIGVAEETLAVPEHVTTGAAIIDWLKSRGENYEAALDAGHKVRMAADHNHIELDNEIGSAREIALFPPMTGG